MMSAEEQINFLKEVPDDHQNYRLYQDFLQIYDPPAVDTDWQDVVFRVGIMRNHHLAARGGNEKTRFSISGSILSQDGIIESTGYDRQTFRANFDQKVTDRLSFGVNLNMSRTVQDNSRVDQPEGSWGKAITTTAMKFSPAIPVYDENGNYSAPYPPGESIDNPMALIKEQINTNTGFSMHMQAFAEYEIIKDLRFRTSYNYKFSNFKNDRWTGKDLLDASGIGKAGVSYSNTNTWLSDNILTYNKEFGIHKLTVMGGYSESGFNSPSLSAGGNTFPTESLKYYALELADPATYSINTGYTDSRLISFLGRINYVLRNKYLVTVNFRADGSSKFAKNNKWGYFPSGAFGWRISEEEFMTAVPQISNFKLRISYGETGSQAISPYQSLASYASTITNLGQNAYTAIFLDNIPNPYLRWETTEQQNIGLDLGLFRNRLNLVADYYIKNTYDLLYTKQIPSYTGYDSQVQNIGNVRNKGIELSLSTVNLDGVFKWSSSFNISFNKNEVLDLGGDQFTLYSGAPTGSSLFSQTSILKIGEPMGSFYGYVFDGIYQNEEECAALPYPTAADCEPGMIKLKDIADEEGDMVPDGKITPEDRTVIGNSHPDFTFGFGNSFSFKGFDMNIMFQGIYGNQIMNLHRASLENIGTLNGLKSMIGAFWDGEGSTNEVQAYEFGQGPPSSRWLEDGSYLRLKNIALGYTFNKSLLENSGIDRLRIYISGTNLWTLTNYSGFDPEIDSNAYASKGDILKGYDYGGYPTAKTYTVGINLSF
jgi:TonB-linked SusC/RagA family outer membrane protein